LVQALIPSLFCFIIMGGFKPIILLSKIKAQLLI